MTKRITNRTSIIIIFTMALVSDKVAGRDDPSPKIIIELTHHHKAKDALFMDYESTPQASNEPVVQWKAKKSFSIVLPVDTGAQWQTLNKTNDDSGLCDKNYVVIDSDAKKLITLKFTKGPDKETIDYVVAVDASTGAHGKAIYFNYDLMQATLDWKDISKN
jgi:hypothetical protein